jgi:hypothetical protein
MSKKLFARVAGRHSRISTARRQDWYLSLSFSSENISTQEVQNFLKLSTLTGHCSMSPGWGRTNRNPKPLSLTSGVENSQSWEDKFDLNLNSSTNQEAWGKKNQSSYKIQVSTREGEIVTFLEVVTWRGFRGDSLLGTFKASGSEHLTTAVSCYALDTRYSKFV